MRHGQRQYHLENFVSYTALTQPPQGNGREGSPKPCVRHDAVIALPASEKVTPAPAPGLPLFQECDPTTSPSSIIVPSNSSIHSSPNVSPRVAKSSNSLR